MTPQIKHRIEQIRRGEVPEGYKKTKVGIVPAEWIVKLLSDVFQKQNAKNTTNAVHNVLTNSATQGIISQMDYFDKRIANDENTASYYLVYNGCFVYNPRISTSAPCGPFNRYDGLEMGIMSPLYTVYIYKDISNSYSDYLSYFFSSSKWHGYMNGIANYGARSDRMNVTIEDMNNLPLPYPPLPEQEKIAKILSAQDRVIELCEKKVEQLKKLKKVFLQKMFPKPGSNVPEWRFPEFTNAWEQRKVSDIAEITAGGTPSTGVQRYWEPKVIPWLSSGEVHKKYIFYTDNKISIEGMNNSSARMVKENSVLIALAGQGKTRGTVAINRIPLTTNQSIAAITFSEDTVPEFVFCNLDGRYDEIRKMSSGDGARGGLNKQIVGEIEIPYTSKPEQRQIGCFFNNIDNLIALHQRKYDEEKQKKKALMQLLLTGIVRVKV